MSTASKATLASSIVFLTGSILYDLYDKEFQLINLRKGIANDIKRQEQEQKNLIDLTRQFHVEKQYKEAMEKRQKNEES